MTTAYELKPWTDVVRPHDDVRSGDLAMGTFAANLAAVAFRPADQHRVYADAEAFFEATYLTDAMRRIADDVLGVLAGEAGNRVLQLRTPFGGGKSHTLLGLYHLAKDRAGSVAGARGELDGAPDPGPVRVAVISGEFHDPARGREVDGRRISTLWGEVAYQLGGWDAYDAMLVDGEESTPPTSDLLVPLLSEAPALLLLDELLVNLVKSKAIVTGDTTLATLALTFVQNLSEAVNQAPGAVMVYSLQASVGEAVQDEQMLASLEHIAARLDARREPVTGDDVLHVVQRRLFETRGDGAVAAAVAERYAGMLQQELESSAETDEQRREAAGTAESIRSRIIDAYPFHPALIDLMYERWGSLPTYQRTRGALQFLATVVHALWAPDAQAQALIGPGDVDLADEHVRTTFFEQVGEANAYSAVVQADFLGDDAGTKVVDRRIGRTSPELERLRVGTRVATAIALLSFGAREGEERGALERDIVEASLVPSLDGNLVRSALHDLRRQTLLYLHYTGRRYRFEPTPNLNKLIVTEEQKLQPDEVLEVVRAHVERAIGGGAGQQIAVWPADASKIADGLPVFVTAYLSPDASDAHEFLTGLVEHGPQGRRKHKNGLALVLPKSVLAEQARASARTLTAVGALLARGSQHQFSGEQRAELKERAGEAQAALDTAAGQMYSRVMLPAGADGPDGVRFDEIDLGTVLAAGRTVQERVRDALTNYVFDSLTPARLRSLTKLDDRGSVPCDEIADAFFSFYEFTKLWSVGPINRAIAEGVAGGQFGYAVRVSADDDGTLRVAGSGLVHVEKSIDAGEIDLGPEARLLTAEVARGLLGEAERPGPTPPDPGPEPRPPVTPPPGVGDEERRRMSLTITATEDDLHTINLALVGLRDVASPGTMRISIKVEAAKSDGPIDGTQFQNRVRQHLEEDPDVGFQEDWQ